MGKEPVVSIMVALVLGLTDDIVDDRLDIKMEARRLSEICIPVRSGYAAKEAERNGHIEGDVQASQTLVSSALWRIPFLILSSSNGSKSCGVTKSLSIRQLC